MSVQFCVLGSGSEGNAALLMTPAVHVLIDAGFFPDELSQRMDGTGATWQTLDAVILTHTHGDHLKKKCLTYCIQHDVKFICHAHHAEQLSGGRYFKKMRERGLLQTYDDNGPFEIWPAPVLDESGAERCCALRFFPVALSHDCKPTFGFRIEARYSSPETPGDIRWFKLGYFADLGHCCEVVTQHMIDLDLLALEFNHDEEMERNSGRHPSLIQRVLGKEGHLSNSQAADVFRRVLETATNGGPKLLVQMHLSRDCNRAELAYNAAQEVVLLTGAHTRVYSTRQDRRGTVHCLP
ncbi:MAG TPA: MBL fold metallo-hydrolase [Planctomycetota bacterium]|nr:MBL fold metallo-hydrolase [Planctomycetota bacterium]